MKFLFGFSEAPNGLEPFCQRNERGACSECFSDPEVLAKRIRCFSPFLCLFPLCVSSLLTRAGLRRARKEETGYKTSVSLFFFSATQERYEITLLTSRRGLEANTGRGMKSLDWPLNLTLGKRPLFVIPAGFNLFYWTHGIARTKQRMFEPMFKPNPLPIWVRLEARQVLIRECFLF